MEIKAERTKNGDRRTKNQERRKEDVCLYASPSSYWSMGGQSQAQVLLTVEIRVQREAGSRLVGPPASLGETWELLRGLGPQLHLAVLHFNCVLDLLALVLFADFQSLFLDE